MDNTPTNAHRRKLLAGVATAAAAVPLVAGLAACQGSGEQETKAGASGAAGAASPGAKNAILTARRKLGPLEVSSVGLGVQNMSRTYQTTIPSRSEMHRIIRTAFDRGLTFYDAAEAYGPHEVERILGEGVAPFRNEIVIAKRFASRLCVGRSIGRGLARATRSLLRREWSSSGAHASGVIDGCFGRLGRRREPPAPDRTPTP